MWCKNKRKNKVQDFFFEFVASKRKKFVELEEKAKEIQ